MRVNFVYCSQPGGWSTPFSDAVIKGFPLYGIEVFAIDNTNMDLAQCEEAIAQAPECAVWYFQRDKDWMLPMVLKTGAKVVAHCHGGPETLQFSDVVYQHRVSGGQAVLTEEMESLAALTVNSRSHKDQLEKFYDRVPPISVTGFPVDMRERDWSSHSKRLIAVPMRLSSA